MCLYTQQDPIGIAGGLNLHGYAGGDPINFSDPFGPAACPDAEGSEDAGDGEADGETTLGATRTAARCVNAGPGDIRRIQEFSGLQGASTRRIRRRSAARPRTQGTVRPISSAVSIHPSMMTSTFAIASS
jgi:hypothetical protein